MKLHLLERLVNDFLEDQLMSKGVDWYYPHALVQQYHEVWNSEMQSSLKDHYDKALRSDITQRWWKRETYRPKEIMMKLIEIDEELAGLAFKDLYNDTASLEGRLSRFEFYMEELLSEFRKKNKREIESYHHQDASMLSLYLAGMFPGKYVLYPGLDHFQKYCRSVESPQIPVIDDLPRYMKVSAIVFKYLEKNELFSKLAANRIETHHKVKYFPLQTVYELMLYSANEKPKR